MKLVAVSVVKNEADIIEAFVRHTGAWVDHHLVFDHDSTDGTREILGALAREGRPLTVFTDEALGNLQQARSNYLTRLAATEFAADWILLLDADEFLTGSDRPGLEHCLAAIAPATPASLLLLNYYPTAADDSAESNPVLRLGHCERQSGGTRKLMVPSALARDQAVVAGKGNHALYRGAGPVPDQALPAQFHLGHFPLRSPGQQAMRIALAELQKLSRGRAHAGLDTHYRLSFQMLAENPETFFATSLHAGDRLRLAPLAYCGGPLRHTTAVHEWSRIIRALLPYLEKLATSHGELLDQVHPPAQSHSADPTMRRLSVEELTASTFAGRDDAYVGFRPQEGWEPPEGPIAETYLPLFHWGLAPATRLRVDTPGAKTARLTIEGLTYSEGQKVVVELNGVALHQHVFGRVNQRERINCRLPLRPGENSLVLRYTEFLQTARDPRKLAVIYLSLRVTGE